MQVGEFQNTDTKTQSLSSVMEERMKLMKQGRIQEAGDDATHARAKWVEATRQMLGLDMKGKPYTFGRINGLTKKWSVEKIRDRYYYCKKQNKCAFVWWGVRKQELAKAKDEAKQ